MSFTGTLTSPKLMAPLQMGRGTATSLRLGSRFSQSLEDWVTQGALLGPLGELDVADEEGFDEVEVGPARRVHEGAVVACQKRETHLELLQHLVGEAGSHVAGVAQPVPSGYPTSTAPMRPVRFPVPSAHPPITSCSWRLFLIFSQLRERRPSS